MIRYTKIPNNIELLLPKAISFLQSRDDIAFAYLFGSLGKDRRTPLSDVDLAGYFYDTKNLGEKRMEMIGMLSACLETDEIDFLVLNTTPVFFRMKVLQSRKVIVDKAPLLRHQFESLTMREYFDFSIKEKAILERRFLSG